MKNLLLTASLLMFANQAMAETVYGRVVESVPYFSKTTVSEPRTKCVEKEVPIYSEEKGNAGESALGGMILGGVLGKVLGGNDAGAAAGAILGGVIGADNSKPGRRTIVGYRISEQCDTYYVDRTVKKQRGWTTTVTYKGLTIVQRTDRRYWENRKVALELTASIKG